MKNGFKTGILAAALLLGIVGTANAQKQIRFGIKGGGTVSNISGHGHGSSTMPRIGYTAGLTVDYAVTHNFYILSGVDFSVKGFETKAGGETPGTKTEAMYVQLPVHAGYAVHVDENTKVIFRAGPYVAYGVSGDTKIEGTDTKFKTFSDNGLKKFDFGAGGGIDIDYKHFTFGVGYNHSILDISKTDDVGVYNSVTHVTVGIKF